MPAQYPYYGHDMGGSLHLPGQHRSRQNAVSRLPRPSRHILWTFPRGASSILKDWLLSRWRERDTVGKPRWKGVDREVEIFRDIQEREQQHQTQSNGIVTYPATPHLRPSSALGFTPNKGVKKINNLLSPRTEDSPSSRSVSSEDLDPEIAPDHINYPIIEVEPDIERAVHLDTSAQNSVEVMPLKTEGDLLEVEIPQQAADLVEKKPKINEEDFENRTRTRLRSGAQAPKYYADKLGGVHAKAKGKKRKAASTESGRKKAKRGVRVKGEPEY